MGFSDRFTFKQILDLENFCEKSRIILLNEENRKDTKESFLNNIDLIKPLCTNQHPNRTYEELENAVKILNDSLWLKDMKIEWRIPTAPELEDILQYILPQTNEARNVMDDFISGWDCIYQPVWSCSHGYAFGTKIVLRRTLTHDFVTRQEVLHYADKVGVKSVIVGKIIKTD